MILELFAGLFMGLQAAFSITLHPMQTYPMHNDIASLESVTIIRAYHGSWDSSSADHCVYYGLMVPYVQDWEDENSQPDPNRIAGQAIVIDRKACPNKPVEAMFLVDQAMPIGSMHRTITASNLLGMKADQRPKWLDQVMARIQRAALTNAGVTDAYQIAQDGTVQQALDQLAAAQAAAASQAASAASAPARAD